MGSQMNFKNFGDFLSGDQGSGGAMLPGNIMLTRQPSIYSLTFDEFQNTLGKEFGSMNMDELLKNIWTAEETQVMTSSAATSTEGDFGGGGILQRQGSLTLPRTLSQKTVDEVWRDFVKETGSTKDSSSNEGSFPQRQPTLGEMTLEEFLVRAGVVREESQQIGKPNDGDFYSELSRKSNNNGLALGFEQPNQNNILLSNQNNVAMQQQQQQPLFPKQGTFTFASSPINSVNNVHKCPPPSNGLVQAGGLPRGGVSIVGVGTGGVTVAAQSGAVNSIPLSMITKKETSPVSPVPYAFGRGRKCSGALEKVVERRQKRMIKNRESAARSRARKQAYTLELEAEIAKLKEMNQELQEKQADIVEMQRNQLLEKMKCQLGAKRQCLRRTLTGPW